MKCEGNLFFDPVEQPLEGNVELRDHPVDGCDPVSSVWILQILFVVGLTKLLRHIERRMGNIQRQIAEERLVAGVVDELNRFVNENIGAVSFGFPELVVVQ